MSSLPPSPWESVKRVAALALAIWSHGPSAGEEKDACFTGRAKHFLEFINGTLPGPLRRDTRVPGGSYV